MIVLNKIQDFFYSLEEKNFYYYIGGFLATMVLIAGLILYYQYDSTTTLINSIEEINDERESRIKPMLSKSSRIKKKLKDINAMLSQETNFKIGEYFKNLKTFIKPAKEIIPIQTDRDDQYRETSLRANFTSITMEHLLKMLQELEKTERIYIKELDIKKSNKTEKSIDVELTIATLLPKLVETD